MQQRYYDPQLGVFLSVDPVTAYGNPVGAFNRYWYANGNPYRFIDPDGRWSPKAHDKLISHAFEGRLSAEDIRILQQSGQDFDRATQSPSESYKHSMAQEGQSGSDAIKQRDNFFNRTMAAARSAADQGNRRGALMLLGQAIHPMMDSSSPEHTNSDGTPKVWRGSVFGIGSSIGLGSFIDGQRHSPSESVGRERLRNLTPEIYRSQDLLLNNAYDWVFREGKYVKTE